MVEFGKRSGPRPEKAPKAPPVATRETAGHIDQLDIELIDTLVKKDAGLRDLLMEAYGIISLDPDAKDDEPLRRSYEDIRAHIAASRFSRGKQLSNETIRKYLDTRAGNLD
jgi:hypothetical protein